MTTTNYKRTIRGTEYTFTAHRTKTAARGQIHPLQPCLVEIAIDGKTWYDAFPLGHPLPADAVVIERLEWRAAGPRWIVTEGRVY